jgi:hypothetical protein
MKELESIWETKIQELSQKRKHNSDNNMNEPSSSKATAKKRKELFCSNLNIFNLFLNKTSLFLYF